MTTRLASHRVLALALLLVLPRTSAAAAAAPPRLSPAAMRADLRLARAVLEESHPGAHRYVDAATLGQAFDRASKAVSRPMTAWEFYRYVATPVATIECAHTSVALPETLRRELDTQVPILPLSVRVIEGKVQVFRDLSGTEPTVAGLELMSLDGRPLEMLLDTIYAATPRDGDVPTSRAWRLSGLRLGSELVRVLGRRSPYFVRVRDARGETRTVTLVGQPRPRLVDSLRARYPQDMAPGSTFALDFIDSIATARITIRRFTEPDSVAQAALHRTLAQSFDSVAAHGTRRLILDLRGNGGGEDEMGVDLLSRLVDKSFTYYDSLVIRKRKTAFARYMLEDPPFPPGFAVPRADGNLMGVGHPNSGTHEPAANHFDGKLIVLIDGRSLSTTSEFLSNLHARRKATYIGEESAGAYGGNTSAMERVVRLPNSGIVLHVPQMTYYMAAHESDPRRGIRPDILVTPVVGELILGRDPAMEMGIALARQAAP